MSGPPHPSRETLLYGLARELVANVVRHARAQTLPPTTLVALGRIQRELGWTPRVALADGLQRTVTYYRAHVA